METQHESTKLAEVIEDIELDEYDDGLDWDFGDFDSDNYE